MRTAVALAVLLLAPAVAAAQDLTIYTYDSFTAGWGPGPQIERAFEAECGCDLKFVAVADGAALLNRLRIEGKNSEADIVLGIDTSLMQDARNSGLFAPHGTDLSAIDVPGGWTDEMFLPYDYGYFAVVYDAQRLAEPPASLKELVEMAGNAKIAIQDPRTSSPGLGLLLWMRAVYGDAAPAAWEKLKGKVLTVTPGWSEAYGLFTSGEAEMVLSYTTSPAYHLKEEGVDRYRAALFAEGHYLQGELAGLTLHGAENPHAKAFLAFMTGPGFQDAIPLANWMYPAGRTSGPLDKVFDQLVRPETALQLPPEEIAANRREWIEEWLRAMSR